MLFPHLSFGSAIVASLFFVCSDCTLRTELEDPFKSLPGDVLSVVTDCLFDSISLRATCASFKQAMRLVEIRHLTEDFSEQYIEEELFRDQVNASLNNPSKQIRLHLRSKLSRRYIFGFDFYLHVDALLAYPHRQIRLNLESDFEEYMVDDFFRDLANVVVAEPLKQIWSDVTYLELRDPSLQDIRPLAALSNLRLLFLDGTRIEDVAPLGGLRDLRELHLSGTRVQNIRPLQRLANLRILNLVGTPVEDISPLDGLVARGLVIYR